jgi:hypothetical protein
MEGAEGGRGGGGIFERKFNIKFFIFMLFLLKEVD